MEDDREIIFNVEKKGGLTLVELEGLLKKWQEKLEMKDWNLSVKIVEFYRKNGYRQSGDFIINFGMKEAQVLMTNDPWRGDEEYTLVHELLHILFYSYDKYCEDILLDHFEKYSEKHGEYMDRLEETVHKVTRIILGRSDR